MKIKGKQGISDNSPEEFNAISNHTKKSFETENDEYTIALKNAEMELSKISEDEWDYDIRKREIEGLKRKERYRIVETYLGDDMWLLRDMLYEPMGLLDLQYIYHFEEFLITATHCGDYVEVKVYLECEYYDKKNYKLLGTNIDELRLLGTAQNDPEKVHEIMTYWREVGDAYDHYK